MPEKKDLKLDISAEAAIQNSGETPRKTTFSLREINDRANEWLLQFTAVSVQEKSIFMQMLSTMINAGLPLLDSMKLLEKQTPNLRLRSIVAQMRKKVESGSSLATAIRDHSEVFSVSDAAVIEAGEKSGKLYEVMKELISQYERLDTIQKKVRGMMLYPIIVFVVMILLIIIVLIFVVPKLQTIFGGSENLPLPTQILIYGSALVREKWWLLLGVFSAVFFGLRYWGHTPDGQRIFQSIKLKIPKIGSIVQKMILSKIARVLGFLLSSGVPMYDSVRMSAHISDNYLYEQRLLLASEDLGKGITLAENLSDDNLFPEMIVSMIAVGEKTASLDSVLVKIANILDDDIDRQVQSFSKIMEPFILAFIAGGAVFMILAVYLPILKLNDQVISTF